MPADTYHSELRLAVTMGPGEQVDALLTSQAPGDTYQSAYACSSGVRTIVPGNDRGSKGLGKILLLEAAGREITLIASTSNNAFSLAPAYSILRTTQSVTL